MHKHFPNEHSCVAQTMLPQHANQELKQKGKSAPGYTLRKSYPASLAEYTKHLQGGERKRSLVNAACMLMASCPGTLLILECAGEDALSEKQQHHLECLGELCTMDCFVPKLI